MKYLKLKDIRKLYFGYEDIAAALGVAIGSARVSASRYVTQGFLIRIKRNIYILKERWDALTTEEIFSLSNLIQVPSYISLMTALSASKAFVSFPDGWHSDSPQVRSASQGNGEQSEYFSPTISTIMGSLMYDRLARTVFLVLGLGHRVPARSFAGFRENGGVWGRGYPPAGPAYGWGGDPLRKKMWRGGRGITPLPPLSGFGRLSGPVMMRGAVAPIPPRARSSAAPGRKPPRRIR